MGAVTLRQECVTSISGEGFHKLATAFSGEAESRCNSLNQRICSMLGVRG